MPLTIDKLTSKKWLSETTCATADLPAAKKQIVPPEWDGIIGEWILNGDDVYVQGNNIQRNGINTPGTETNFLAAAVKEPQVVMLTDVLGVVCYIDNSNLLKAKAFSLTANGTIALGSAATINNAVTTFFRIIKVNSTTYATAYVDDGGDDYLCARMGSVDGTTITQGDELELTAAAVKVTNSYLGLCQPRDGVLAVAYALTSDTFGYVIAATFSTLTIATPGTAVAFDGANAVTYIDMCSDRIGYVAVAYNGASNYCTVNLGTVSAAAVVAFAGSAEAMNAAASTSIRILSPSTAQLLVGWIAAGDPYLIAATTATTVVTQGTAKQVLAGTCLTSCPSMLSNNEGIIIYEEDGTTGYAYVAKFYITWSTKAITLDSVYDICTEASTQETYIACTTQNSAIVVYDDAGASNYGNMNYIVWSERIIDVRSSNASQDFDLRIFPTFGRETTF